MQLEAPETMQEVFKILAT